MIAETDPALGLTDAEAEERLRVEGPNELPVEPPARCRGESPSTSCASRCSCCCSPAARIYLAPRRPAGGAHPARLRRRGRRHHALPGAQDRARARGAARPVEPARARRSATGERTRIAGREVVRGDVLVFVARAIASRPTPIVARPREHSQRRRVAAHRRVGAGAQDRAGDGAGRAVARPGGDDLPFVYRRHAGRAGPGADAEVVATGARTEIGRIGKALRRGRARADARCSARRRRLVRRLAVVGGARCAWSWSCVVRPGPRTTGWTACSPA